MELDVIDPDLKRRILFLHHVVGQSLNQIGNELGISRTTLWRWRKSFKEQQGIQQLTHAVRVVLFTHCHPIS